MIASGMVLHCPNVRCIVHTPHIGAPSDIVEEMEKDVLLLCTIMNGTSLQIRIMTGAV